MQCLKLCVVYKIMSITVDWLLPRKGMKLISKYQFRITLNTEQSYMGRPKRSAC